MLDQPRRLAIFAAVVEAGSFVAAARVPGLSASVLSEAVTALERDSGTALFYRSTRRLRLTERGLAVLTPARQVLSHAAEAGEVLQSRNPDPQGRLRLTCPAVLQNEVFLQDIAKFAARYPRVTLDLDFTDAPRHLLRDGFDLALRPGAAADSTLATLRIIGGQQVLVAAPQMPVPSGTDPDDLTALAFVGGPQRLVLRHATTGQTRDIAVTGQIAVNSGLAALQLACVGAGVAVLPRLTPFARDRNPVEARFEPRNPPCPTRPSPRTS